MKSLTQLLVLAATLLSMAAAATLPSQQGEKFQPCPPCKSPGCSSENYLADVPLTEDKPDPEPAIVIYRTFFTPKSGLKAIFTYEGGSHSLPPAGTITSVYKDQEVVLTVNMVSEGNSGEVAKTVSKSTMAYKIKPDTTCTLAFPKGFLPLNIRNVVMSTNKP